MMSDSTRQREKKFRTPPGNSGQFQAIPGMPGPSAMVLSRFPTPPSDFRLITARIHRGRPQRWLEEAAAGPALSAQDRPEWADLGRIPPPPRGRPRRPRIDPGRPAACFCALCDGFRSSTDQSEWMLWYIYETSDLCITLLGSRRCNEQGAIIATSLNGQGRRQILYHSGRSALGQRRPPRASG